MHYYFQFGYSIDLLLALFGLEIFQDTVFNHIIGVEDGQGFDEVELLLFCLLTHKILHFIWIGLLLLSYHFIQFLILIGLLLQLLTHCLVEYGVGVAARHFHQLLHRVVRLLKLFG